MLNFGGRLGAFDHARLREDLRSMPGPIDAARQRGRSLHPPMALLERYGDDLLHATKADQGAWLLRSDDAMQEWMAGQSFLPVLGGTVELSWLAVAVVLGRGDLRPRFRQAGRFDYDAALHWLVLYGIREHGLFGLATTRLVRQLLAPPKPDAPAPLSLLLLRERPDLEPLCREPFVEGFTPGLRQWLERTGVAEYGLHWCLPPRDLAAGVALPPGWRPPVPAPPAPVEAGPAFRGRCASLRLDRNGPPPGWASDRALGRPGPEGAAVFATDIALRLPHPGGRRATLIIQAAPRPGAPAPEALSTPAPEAPNNPAPGTPSLVALHRDRPIGAAGFDPAAGGPIALTLCGFTSGDELPLRLCLAGEVPIDPSQGWARWLSLWLIAE